MRSAWLLLVVLLAGSASGAESTAIVDLDHTNSQSAFPIVANGNTAAIYVSPQSPETVRVAAEAFAADVERVSGVRPRMVSSLAGPLPENLIVVGVVGSAPELDRLRAAHRLVTTQAEGKWEAAVTVTIVDPPQNVLPGVKNALVIAGADRRGTAYALFTLSRQMGVSPWTWWADVPVQRHSAVYVRPGLHVQPSPSVQYRGVFLNDEDWGLRPWAAKKMDPTIDHGKGNIGPHTYERIFELLLRLHANSLWPGMHPGTLAFNAVPENAKLADKWGIVMGSSHSEALLRNNVGEWSEEAPPKGDGPWNYQVNAPAMNAYWDKRVQENGKYENFYTVGLRGLHDSGLEATGTPEVKARLVEDVMANQRKLLAQRVNPDVTKIPQVIWLYKESLDLYRVGMKIPDDVTLGWADDNYGYIRELPNAAEQKRAGGSGVYYHVSYWGAPHDYLWLCTTPPELIREEMTKAYDHNARKYWVLNVGDLKPSEIDTDYFMQVAADEPSLAGVSQHEFLRRWFAEQFPSAHAEELAGIMDEYYALNFVRKPEFMGFNGYNDDVKRTAFNPLAWPSDGAPDENHARSAAWARLRQREQAAGASLSGDYAAAFYELVGYPVEASAAMNDKFLSTDLIYLDAHEKNGAAIEKDAADARAAYEEIQAVTKKYNSLENGKWDGMMSAAPRERHVFEMPRLATAADADGPLPAAWSAGAPECRASNGEAKAAGAEFSEQYCTVSINAAHFVRKSDTSAYSAKMAGVRPQAATWKVLQGLGLSGASMVYGDPGLLAQMQVPENQPGTMAGPTASLEYEFTTKSAGSATLALHLLPTFPVDSDHRLRYAVALDGGKPMERDASGGSGVHSEAAGDGPSGADWPQNVLRNSAIDTIALGQVAPGHHIVRLYYRDPGVVFEHIVITFPGAPPAYPVPPETR